jgi:hypothetical protein
MSDSPTAPSEIHATGIPGFSAWAQSASGHIAARKRPAEVQVRFASEDCAIQTLEGVVHASIGDAIVSGIAGEQWPVSRAHFGDKYRPVPPLEMGRDGIYLSLPIDVLAVPMQTAFKVRLADGRSWLGGRAGDWLVDYGDGSLGVIAATIFNLIYQSTEPA